VFIRDTSYSLVEKLLLQHVLFSHNAQHQTQTDRRTDDIIMPIANHSACCTIGQKQHSTGAASVHGGKTYPVAECGIM